MEVKSSHQHLYKAGVDVAGLQEKRRADMAKSISKRRKKKLAARRPIDWMPLEGDEHRPSLPSLAEARTIFLTHTSSQKFTPDTKIALEHMAQYFQAGGEVGEEFYELVGGWLWVIRNAPKVSDQSTASWCLARLASMTSHASGHPFLSSWGSALLSMACDDTSFPCTVQELLLFALGNLVACCSSCRSQFYHHVIKNTGVSPIVSLCGRIQPSSPSRGPRPLDLSRLRVQGYVGNCLNVLCDDGSDRKLAWPLGL